MPDVLLSVTIVCSIDSSRRARFQTCYSLWPSSSSTSSLFATPQEILLRYWGVSLGSSAAMSMGKCCVMEGETITLLVEPAWLMSRFSTSSVLEESCSQHFQLEFLSSAKRARFIFWVSPLPCNYLIQKESSPPYNYLIQKESSSSCN